MSKTVFDHLNAIFSNQSVHYYDELSDVDKKTFNIYIINMGISMNVNFIPIVNEINKYWDQLGPREVYLFYSQCLPKGKQFNKWVKGKKDLTYDDDLVSYVTQHYQISKIEAKKYLSIFYSTDEGKEELKNILKGYGLDNKVLKKYRL